MRTTALLSALLAFYWWTGVAQAQAPIPPPAGVAPMTEPSANEEDPKKKKFAYANPEDITNENFPDLIESFDYPNADIADVIKAISELTGKNFIVDPQVRGKVTIIAPTQVSVAEAYKAFLSALAINGYTVVPSGKFLKIKSARNAQRDSIETYSGNYFPNTDQMITRIIKLKYISAADVNKQLRILPSKDGEMVPYEPTNSIIISDYGSNIERVMNIINQLDVPGFEEQLAVIRIRYAKAKDVADLLDQIINKGESSNKSRFSSGVPRFRRNTNQTSSGGSGAESYSLVVSDDRTNSIIVVGNKAGIAKIRRLISKLDFKLRPEDQGGVFVYYVRHGEAEQIANVLNGIATESKKSQQSGAKASTTTPSPTGTTNPLAQSASVFGGEVQVAADKNTNSLIITASRQDYEVVKNILSKIDIARDQVFVKTIIMEMNATKTQTWGVDYYAFDRSSKGVGRIGFRSSPIGNLLNPATDSGAILGFGSGQTFELKAGDFTATVTSLVGLIKFLKGAAGGNVLSTPQIMALDNEEAEIEVGETIPVNLSRDSTATAGTLSTTANREDVTIKLNLTPFISPDTDSVKLKIEQQVKQLSRTKVEADELAKSAVATTKRVIKTQIVVNSGDTAVLGGLMSDVESEDVTKVPVLGDIPILGWLFKGKTVDKRKSNLVVFITPKIIRNTTDNANLLNDKINERITFIQRYMNGRDPHGEAIDKLPRRSFGNNQPPPSSSAPSPLMEPTDDGDDDDASRFSDDEPKEEPAVETF
ncbi:MAG: type II secretion system secretin GspD [Bdellovibrionaceae bacterium]|nr:type II secretion system secretin GspD [Bdellovibrionales bacterium]MCB9082909.1 type II secretion system secretin GspD [Pseudobdellovibrionaceae bacterium]